MIKDTLPRQFTIKDFEEKLAQELARIEYEYLSIKTNDELIEKTKKILSIENNNELIYRLRELLKSFDMNIIDDEECVH